MIGVVVGEIVVDPNSGFDHTTIGSARLGDRIDLAWWDCTPNRLGYLCVVVGRPMNGERAFAGVLK